MLSHLCINTIVIEKPPSPRERFGADEVRVCNVQQQDLPGGKRVNVLVAMSYHTGVILAEPYYRMSGSFFAEFVRSRLPRAFIDESMKS